MARELPIAVPDGLPEHHLAALAWFVENRGQVTGWPRPIMTNGGQQTLLATKAKGIYKPRWSTYALSVREMLDSPYRDLAPVHHEDGSWTYLYSQEGKSPSDALDRFTNQGLLACMRDGVPIGVMRQSASAGRVQYEVLGLALVTRWSDGLFTLEGVAPSGGTRSHPGPLGEIEVLSQTAADVPGDPPTDPIDGRRRVLASILARQGQKAFRAALITAYGGKCAITGTGVLPTLEAAHIRPYSASGTNSVRNGLLLRADLHTLFDVGLVAIDSSDHRILLAASLAGTAYEYLEGERLRIPRRDDLHPDREHLDSQRQWAGL